MSDTYRLEGTAPVRVSRDEAGAAWKSDRRVRYTVSGGVAVSTVFLVIDHGFGFSEKPVLFETLVIGGVYDQQMDRYTTWDEAVAGHEAWVARVMNPPFFWLGAEAARDG